MRESLFAGAAVGFDRCALLVGAILLGARARADCTVPILGNQNLSGIAELTMLSAVESGL